eukprot:gene26146-34756_t
MRFQVRLKTANWRYITSLIGSLHQLKEGPQKVPYLVISLSAPLSSKQQEESSSWSRVKFTSDLKPDNKSISIPSGYVFDAAGLEIRRAELISDPELIIKARALGRGRMKKLAGENIKSLLIPLEDSSPELKCHIDIRPNAVKYGAEAASDDDETLLKSLKDEKLPVVAIGAPTTSKGMRAGNRTVLLRALLPSIQKTVSLYELTQFKMVIFIGFDKGDMLLDNKGYLEQLRKDAAKVLPKSVSIIFVRLKRFQRVAATWNMIFSLALQYGVTWFYQVNDDLTLETSGWLTKFTSALLKVNGRGVAGPSDTFQDFRCSILTQAFVHRSHFDRFGFLYPLEFCDWKSDRWLSFVYGDASTFCWRDIRAHNGAVGTRYTACPYNSWRVVLERTQLKAFGGVG